MNRAIPPALLAEEYYPVTEVRYKGKPPAQRVADRLKPSNSDAAVNVSGSHGTGPTRVHFTHHWAGHNAEHHNPKSKTELPIVPTGGGRILGQKGE